MDDRFVRLLTFPQCADHRPTGAFTTEALTAAARNDFADPEAFKRAARRCTRLSHRKAELRPLTD